MKNGYQNIKKANDLDGNNVTRNHIKCELTHLNTRKHFYSKKRNQSLHASERVQHKAICWCRAYKANFLAYYRSDT